MLYCYSDVTKLECARPGGCTLHMWEKCGKCPNVMAVLIQSFISVTALLQCYIDTSVQFYPDFQDFSVT